MGKSITRGEIMSIQIFCDFDGTITKNDNIIAIMKQFGPQEADEIKNQILSQKLSIQEGVGKLFSLLSTDLRNDIIKFIDETLVIRPGFQEFIKFTKEHRISLYIVSGGMDFFVHPTLSDFVDRQQIYCNATDFSSDTIQVNWPHTCDEHCNNQCGLCKPTLIRKLSPKHDYKIVIGDSITDLQAAKLADKVFARDFLITKCEEHGIPYTPFETFHDINLELQQLLEVTK